MLRSDHTALTVTEGEPAGLKTPTAQAQKQHKTRKAVVAVPWVILVLPLTECTDQMPNYTRVGQQQLVCPTTGLARLFLEDMRKKNV
jgi:hypothetical protein